jgi:hypothetical protein
MKIFVIVFLMFLCDNYLFKVFFCVWTFWVCEEEENILKTKKNFSRAGKICYSLEFNLTNNIDVLVSTVYCQLVTVECSLSTVKH